MSVLIYVLIAKCMRINLSLFCLNIGNISSRKNTILVDFIIIKK